jgi:hypothetical protein
VTREERLQRRTRRLDPLQRAIERIARVLGLERDREIAIGLEPERDEAGGHRVGHDGFLAYSGEIPWRDDAPAPAS